MCHWPLTHSHGRRNIHSYIQKFTSVRLTSLTHTYATVPFKPSNISVLDWGSGGCYWVWGAQWCDYESGRWTWHRWISVFFCMYIWMYVALPVRMGAWSMAGVLRSELSIIIITVIFNKVENWNEEKCNQSRSEPILLSWRCSSEKRVSWNTIGMTIDHFC